MSAANAISEDSNATNLCVQPNCPLKKPSHNSRYLASIFSIGIVDGSLDDYIDGSQRMKFRRQCVRCARGVLKGRKTYPTEAEWIHLVDLGHWHERRRHRRSRR